MPVDITVVVYAGPTTASAAKAVSLLRSLDLQTLPADRFDVLTPVDEVSADAAELFAHLAQRRTNLRVGTGAELAVRGRHVVRIGPEQVAHGLRFQPDALAALVAVAAESEASVVLGRADASPGSPVTDALLIDAEVADPAPALLVAAPVVVVEREFDTLGPLDDAAAASVLAAAKTVRSLGSRAVVRTTGPAGTAAVAPAVSSCSAHWDDGVVELTVSATSGTDTGIAVLALRHKGSGAEHCLPETATVVDGSFRLTARIDVRTAASGEPLADGLWQPTIGVHGPGMQVSGRPGLPATELAVGVVDGTPLVPHVVDDVLTLDVGATRAPVVAGLSEAQVSFAEDAHGTLLVGRLPEVVASGSARVPGQVLLGSFPLRAELVVGDGAPRLESYLSGLAGTQTLSTRFGSGKPAGTGLSVRIAGTGEMTAIITPPQAASTAVPEVASTVVTKESATQPTLAQRMRRSTPAALEPAVRKLAANPTARRAYRSLNRKLRDRG